jgi:hypothetical protein
MQTFEVQLNSKQEIANASGVTFGTKIRLAIDITSAQQGT